MQIEKLLEQLLLIEDDELRMEKPPKTFEDDPMNFILNKYQNLKEILSELMTENFEEYITGIYIIAPKPTTFKIVLHNGQYFFLTYTQEAYQATIAGKNYFLLTIGEKQRAMSAIARILRWGSPLKTKGPGGAEQSDEATETGDTTDTTETPPAEGGGEETGGEEETLEESKKVLKQLIEGKEKASLFEQISVDMWNAALAGKKDPPKKWIKYKALYPSIQEIVKNLKNKQPLIKYSQKKDPVSKWWQEAQGVKKIDEPKTDIKSQEGNYYRISVKQGSSQLMSPEKKEAIATIKAAALASGISTQMENKAIEIVKKFAARTKTNGLNTTELSKAKKADLDKTNKAARKIYDDAYEAHREFIEFTNELFKKSPDFKKEFAYEAASGKKKFETSEGTAPPAMANYVLSISTSKDYAELHPMPNSNAKIVKKIVNNMKINVTMKSNSYEIAGKYAGYGFYSSARIALEDLLKKSETIGEAYEKYEKEKSQGLLNEEKSKLYENIFKKAFDWLKNKVQEIWNLLTEKIKQTIEMVKSGFENLMKAMEIEPDVPEEVYTQEIDFS